MLMLMLKLEEWRKMVARKDRIEIPSIVRDDSLVERTQSAVSVHPVHFYVRNLSLCHSASQNPTTFLLPEPGDIPPLDPLENELIWPRAHLWQDNQ